MTNHQKILTIMAKEPQRYFKQSDFMKPELGQYFVGYKVAARLSELMRDYPDIIETKKDGKYQTYRLKMENLKDWYYSLDPKLRRMFEQPKETDEEIVERLGYKFV